MRNCVENRGIVVPSYANLRLYGCGFELSVTLHITSAMLPYLRDVMGIEANGKLFFVIRKRLEVYATTSLNFDVFCSFMLSSTPSCDGFLRRS